MTKNEVTMSAAERPVITLKRFGRQIITMRAGVSIPSHLHSLPAPRQLTDSELYALCREFGSRALEWRRKFIGLLPEVNRREQISRQLVAPEGGKSWLGRQGFSSIFEFAAKLGGISEDQVMEVLRLERKIADRPELHSLLVSGQVSHHKIARVVSIATPETAQFWATKTLVLSKSALNTLVKDEKILQDALSGQSSLPEKSTVSNVQLKSATADRLKRLQEKGIDIDDLINRFLDRREQELTAQKAKFAAEINTTATLASPSARRSISRHIPAKIRKIVQQEHGTKCSIPHCPHPAVTIHHTRRFALAGSHDPRYLAPLCREHHQIAHSIDLTFQDKRSWHDSVRKVAPYPRGPSNRGRSTVRGQEQRVICHLW